MIRFVRPLISIAFFFFVAGTATCHFGTEYEISQLSEVYTRVSDPNVPVNPLWRQIGIVMNAICLIIAAAAGVIYLLSKNNNGSPVSDDRNREDQD